MSQLIQLKQRIKAIQSIKKITETMRLIAMSSHSKLKKQAEQLRAFEKEIVPLMCALNHSEQQENHPIGDKKLFILFASEKGLCGSFNSTMFQAFDQNLKHLDTATFHVITVGKKASVYADQHGMHSIKQFHNALPNRLEIIAQDIYEMVMQIHTQYQSVQCIFSNPKTFFHQEAIIQTIIPVEQQSCNADETINIQHYEWIQPKQEVRQALFNVLLKTSILLIIAQSMLSEQSSRFLSMDNATNSATNLLKEMKITFNKIRQAKITRELIELSSNF